MNKRLARATSFLCQEISRLLMMAVSDKRLGMLTVSKVNLSPDLSRATIFVSVFGNEFPPDTVIGFLDRQKREMQAALARSLRWKRIPKLAFCIDTSTDYAAQIERVLEDIKEENAGRAKNSDGSI